VWRQPQKPGQVGLARASDGSYYVLRAAEVETSRQPWDEELSAWVRNYVVNERREHMLQELEAALRRDARIKANEKALKRLPSATWEELD